MRKDRRKPTIYTEERAQLTTEKNETYIISRSYVNQLSTNCQPSDNQMSAQNKVKEIKRNKYNELTLLSADADAQPRFDYQSVIDTFNSVCISLPKVKKLDDKRRKAIKSASKNLGDISFTDLFAKVERSDFLTGRDGTWSAGFDWILKPANLIKIIEGNYDNKNQPESTNTRAEREERKRKYNAYADDRY